jgi:hypothetical protein
LQLTKQEKTGRKIMSILNDINTRITEAAQSAGSATAMARTVVSDNQVVRRYQDAYAVAKTANAFGNVTKILGIVSAVIIAFIGLIMMLFTATSFDSAGAGFVMFLFTLTFGAIVGAIFYILGIVLSALGQILMSGLDTAVNGSPFMTQEQKAQAMNLTH